MNKNPNFNYEDDNFLKKIDHEHEKYISLIAKSTGYISPGDVLRFTYNSELVHTLVVSCKRGNGIFLSSQNNMLVSCFKLDDASEAVLKIIIRSIYKDKGLAKYSLIKNSLKSILGSKNFRTYKLSNMLGLNKVSIDLKKLVTEEEKDKKQERLR